MYICVDFNVLAVIWIVISFWLEDMNFEIKIFLWYHIIAPFCLGVKISLNCLPSIYDSDFSVNYAQDNDVFVFSFFRNMSLFWEQQRDQHLYIYAHLFVNRCISYLFVSMHKKKMKVDKLMQLCNILLSNAVSR